MYPRVATTSSSTDSAAFLFLPVIIFVDGIVGTNEVKFVWIGCGDCAEIFEVLSQWTSSNHDHIELRIFAVEMISNISTQCPHPIQTN